MIALIPTVVLVLVACRVEAGADDDVGAAVGRAASPPGARQHVHERDRIQG
jgi:hypothetical protein